jgi:hypothetical protein
VRALVRAHMCEHVHACMCTRRCVSVSDCDCDYVVCEMMFVLVRVCGAGIYE